MTSLEQLSLAEFTDKWARQKVYENSHKKFLGICLDLVWNVKCSTILIFKVIFLWQKMAESFWFFFHWRIWKCESKFYFLHILKTLIFHVLNFLKMCPNFDFDTKLSQVHRTFLWLFSQTFGLAYSPVNSAKLSCSSEVSLGPLHVLWQVSFDYWVTWSISSWQEYYKSVFFPKLSDV